MANEVTSFEVQGNDYSIKPDLTFDSTPTIGSANPVTSNGIALAVQNAAIGTSISIGRVDGSPVGYCSISYGGDNIASGDYSIVFGHSNSAYSAYNIISGENNVAYGDGVSYSGLSRTDGHHAIFGLNNSTDGGRCVVVGQHNHIGFSIERAVPTYTPLGSSDNNIYIGYVDLAQKKIFHDPEHTSEIALPSGSSIIGDRGTVYLVDLTDNGTQNIGDIYYRYRQYTTSPWEFKKMKNDGVELVDRSYNHQYHYRGKCYYNMSTRKNYSDSNMTIEIPSSNDSVYDIYFDANGLRFVVGQLNYSTITMRNVTVGGGGQSPNNERWHTCKPYKGRRSGGNSSTSTGSLHTQANGWNGRAAYIKHDINDQSTLYRVYDSPDYTNDITDQLYDGECVVDISTGGMIHYVFNHDNHLEYGILISSMNYGNIICGSDCSSAQGQGSIICGYHNALQDKSSACAVFGANNTISCGSGGYQPSSYLSIISVGSGNTIENNTGYFVEGMTIGRDNLIRAYGNSSSDFVIGENNNITGDECSLDFAYGYYNNVKDSEYSHAYGNENHITNGRRSIVIGSSNIIEPNGNIVNVIEDKFGILSGGGIVYDWSTKTYTYPTDKIFKIYLRNHMYDDSIYFNRYAYSSDGHTLENYAYSLDTISPGFNTGYIFGYNNIYTAPAKPVQYKPWNNDTGCFIIGASNSIYGKTHLMGVGCIGYNLKVDRVNRSASYFPERDGALYVGQYNSLDNTNYAQFVVGGGSGDNNRKNLFIVYQSYGIASLPEAPTTISSLVSMSSVIGVPAGKGLITYEMLQDYTGGHSGSPVPNVTTIILDKDDWSNFEQTVDTSGITTGSVVMVNPAGNPHAYYTDEIYLKSQANGSLTFGCSVAPSVDIDVKVVYWT